MTQPSTPPIRRSVDLRAVLVIDYQNVHLTGAALFEPLGTALHQSLIDQDGELRVVGAHGQPLSLMERSEFIGRVGHQYFYKSLADACRG